ncbi:MAG: electron transfer flavoprotein subunit beta/FixA family protein [Bacillota bacterium]|nr:electron transfer flavoprotein subunit beta/FixA family protein [Bacillota bacterium]
MKIVVCIKQVPDTNEVRLDPKTGTLIREGVPSIINPDDKAGLEAALRLKDRYGAEVTVLTMGPPQATAALKEAYAMGADRVILLTDRAFAGADTWATSATIASALKKLDYDLIVTGRQAIDGDTAQVGPQIAEHLGIPQVSYVSAIDEADDKHIVVQRTFEDAVMKIRMGFPCLITALSELNEARFMSVRGVIDAHRGLEIETWGFADIDADPENTGLKGSPTKVKKSFTKGAKQAGKVIEGTPRELAIAIIDKLHEKFIV